MVMVLSQSVSEVTGYRLYNWDLILRKTRKFYLHYCCLWTGFGV